MKIQDIQQHLTKEGITATEAQIKALGVALEDITPESIGVIVEQLRNQSGTIAPADTAGTIVKPKSKGKRSKLVASTPEITIDTSVTTEAEANVSLVKDRLREQVAPMLDSFDADRTDVLRETAGYMLHSTATMQSDVLNLYKAGLEVMPAQNFRFVQDVDHAREPA